MVDPATGWMCAGADDGTRTRNLRFTKPLLYQLSYVGATGRALPQEDRFRRRGMIWPPASAGQARDVRGLRVLDVAGAVALAAGSPGSRSSSDAVAALAAGARVPGAGAFERFAAFGGVVATA